MFTSYDWNDAWSKQKTKWPAWNHVLPVFLKRKFLEYKKMLYQKYKEGYDFWAISGLSLANRFYQPKQTQLPVASYSSSSIFGRNEYCRAQWQKHQVLFNKAPPHLCPRKHSVFTKILHQLLFQLSFQVKMKTLIEQWICFASRLRSKLLIWMVRKDHFARIWGGFIKCWIESLIKSMVSPLSVFWDHFMCIY